MLKNFLWYRYYEALNHQLLPLAVMRLCCCKHLIEIFGWTFYKNLGHYKLLLCKVQCMANVM